MAQLYVVSLSDAFAGFWQELAADLDVTVETMDGAEAAVPTPGAAALLLSAGGVERHALQWLKDNPVPHGVPTFVVGADPGRRIAMQCIKHGANDYLALPDDVEVLRNAVSQAIEQLRQPSDCAERADAPGAFAAIVGRSPALRSELARAARLLPHRNATALILGETGTGKELLAQAMHAGGPRCAAPFVPVNCSALPHHLVESELFGHERGAFTDAHTAKPGLFEVASGGTLFLDEIGDVPMSLQAKLLRVLDDKQVRRVGGTKSRAVDVRIIAATNEDLEHRVRDGEFREDLYFRLSAVVFRLPPLRERGDDVIEIAQSLLHTLAQEHNVPPVDLPADLHAKLRAYPWPGNVRELKNAVERAMLLSPPGELRADELIPRGSTRVRESGPIPFPAPLHEITHAAAQATLEWCGGNRAESARRLKISPRRLRRLLCGAERDDEESEVASS